MAYVLIDPQETLDYTCDWSTVLDDVGSPSDTIDSSSWKVTPQVGSPQEPDLSDAKISGNNTTIFITGAVAGQVYFLTNAITTGQGRTFERSITLRCEQR